MGTTRAELYWFLLSHSPLGPLNNGFGRYMRLTPFPKGP